MGNRMRARARARVRGLKNPQSGKGVVIKSVGEDTVPLCDLGSIFQRSKIFYKKIIFLFPKKWDPRYKIGIKKNPLSRDSMDRLRTKCMISLFPLGENQRRMGYTLRRFVFLQDLTLETYL